MLTLEPGRSPSNLLKVLSAASEHSGQRVFVEPLETISDGAFFGGSMFSIPSEAFDRYVKASQAYAKDLKMTVESIEGSSFKISQSISKSLKGIGYLGLAINTGLDVYNIGLNRGSSESWVRFGIGATITASGFIPYVGPVISIGLGAVEMQGGFDHFYDYAAGRQKNFTWLKP